MTLVEPKLIYGPGDLLSSLDECRKRIVNGEIEGIVILELDKDGNHFFRTTWIDDMTMRWARFLAIATDYVYHLQRDGLDAQ